MAMEYFCAYHSFDESMEELNYEERGRLFTACLQYNKTGEHIELTGNERFVFPTFKSQIDRDKAKYAKKCKKNTDSINKRWTQEGDDKEKVAEDTNEYERTAEDTNEYERIKSDTFDTKEKEKEKEKEKAKEKDISPNGDCGGQAPTHPPEAPRPKRVKFTPPTLAEVQSYVAERHSPVDPQEFIDFYASKGWMVGKAPMKDWKAACRNAEKWERWERHSQQHSAVTANVHEPAEGNVSESVAWMREYLDGGGGG